MKDVGGARAATAIAARQVSDQSQITAEPAATTAHAAEQPRVSNQRCQTRDVKLRLILLRHVEFVTLLA